MELKNIEAKNPAVKFANMVFICGIIFSIFLIIYPIYKIYFLPTFTLPKLYIIVILCGFTLAVFFILGLKKFSSSTKVNLSLLFFSVGVTIYGLESYLEFADRSIEPELFAKQMGIPYDSRTYIDVLDDLKETGVNVFPDIYPASYLKSDGLISNEKKIYPLGSISNSSTVYSNEAGYFPIIETDEHGFNNPKGLYIENELDIALIGDSFTAGKSVQSTESIGGVLRKLDFNVISFGMRGNGPLLEFASLKEYAEPLKPKIVLWVYFVNDIPNLLNEIKSSSLKKYIDQDNYSQKLIFRQEEINDVLINYAEIERQKEYKKSKKKNKNKKKKITINRVKNIAKLSTLRRSISLTRKPNINIPEFKIILTKSKEIVSGWGGKLYFVYLPRYQRQSIGLKEENNYRNFALQTVTELDIPVIDIYKEVFENHPDPLSLFPFRLRHLHYNAEGYKLIAETIASRLKSDGYNIKKPEISE